MTGAPSEDQFENLPSRDVPAYLYWYKDITILAEMGILEPLEHKCGLSWCIREDGSEVEPDYSESMGTSVLGTDRGRYLVSLDGNSNWLDETDLLRLYNLLCVAADNIAKAGCRSQWCVHEAWGDLQGHTDHLVFPRTGIVSLGDGCYAISLNENFLRLGRGLIPIELDRNFNSHVSPDGRIDGIAYGIIRDIAIEEHDLLRIYNLLDLTVKRISKEECLLSILDSISQAESTEDLKDTLKSSDLGDITIARLMEDLDGLFPFPVTDIPSDVHSETDHVDNTDDDGIGDIDPIFEWEKEWELESEEDAENRESNYEDERFCLQKVTVRTPFQR